MKVKILVVLLLILISLLLVACSRASSPEYDENNPAGFWDGVWHGMTYGVIFLWDTFFKVDDPTLYATYNTGYWYNCGFACIGPLIMFIIFGSLGGILKAIAD